MSSSRKPLTACGCSSYGACPARALRILAYGLLVIIIGPASSAVAQIAHIEEAARLLDRGQTAQAEVEARKALSDSGTRPLALAMLGTIRLQEGKLEESVTFLTHALALNSHLIGARSTLGTAYLLQGKLELAKRSFERVLQLDPSNSNARSNLARVQASLHNFQESLDTAAPIFTQLKQTEDGLLLLASDYAALGRKEGMKELVDDWKHLAAPAPEASVDFANFLAAAGFASEATGIFESQSVNTAAQSSSTVAFKLARGYLTLGALDRAEANLQLALSLDPQCVPCELGMADVAEKQKNGEKELAHLIAAKRLEPKNPEILFRFGKLCLERNLLDDALPALEQATNLRPDEDSYTYTLGSAYVGRHDLPKAASAFGKLLQKHPQDAVLHYAMGAVYYLQAKYPEAESAFKESLRLNPSQVAASYYLGLTYAATGEDDHALAVFRNVVKDDPQHTASYVKLGSILLRQHQYEESQRDLERALTLDPNSVEAHYEMGLLLRRLGKTAESDEHLAESRKLEAEHRAQSEVHLRLLLPD